MTMMARNRSALRPLSRRVSHRTTNGARPSAAVSTLLRGLSPTNEIACNGSITTNGQTGLVSPIRCFSTTSDTDTDTDATTSKEEGKTETTKTDTTAKEPETESMEFQAETRQLLDIVTNSLYTEKEVFLRELVSNASDALEKLRHVQSTSMSTIDPDVELAIHITTDLAANTLTISDTGIGMTKDEMKTNLGTIARSGSKAFVKQLNENKGVVSGDFGIDPSKGIIGKFGVGFYSAFMVGDEVEVRSRSAYRDNESETPKLWKSSGIGSYTISDLPEDIEQGRGTSIVIDMKDQFIEFCDAVKVDEVLRRYSNFVDFPIYLNGMRVNAVDAIWSRDPKEVETDDYHEFYKYIANAQDLPQDILHFRAEAPIDVKALLFIPSFHSEKYGMGQMQPGVSLYSRKVLIESNSKDILPEWLRFLKGAVDSEDLPLSISREKAQDAALIAKLRRALTRKFISHLNTMRKKDFDRYLKEFFGEFQFFLKEGICQDFEFQEPLAKLLYFHSSKGMAADFFSLEEYVSRCPPEQKEIYFLCAPSRDLAVQSPYLEAFEKAGREVLFVYTAIDDFTMSTLGEFEGRKIVSVETAGIDLGPITKTEDEEEDDEPVHQLSDRDAHDFCKWFQEVLPEKVASCRVTDRLSSSPAVVTDNESGSMRRMMRFVETQSDSDITLPPQRVEINPKHPIIVGLNNARKSEALLGKICAEQVFDNCLIAAGILDDSRTMLPRLNDILRTVVQDFVEPNDDESTAVKTDSDDKKKKSNDDENKATNAGAGSDGSP